MNRTRAQTPQAAVIPPSLRATAPETSGSAIPLRGAVYLTGPEGDHTLFSVRALIGRAPHCRVVIADPLVSREHALLRISNDEVVIEDLRSANGVYVNNVRIYEPQKLFEGDRILLGTQELCVFADDAVGRPITPQLRSNLSRPGLSAIPRSAVLNSTDRADALEVLGKLAERLMDQDLPIDAERVLNDHLKKLLDGARTGLPLPPNICENASRLALLLAGQLHNGRWVNYAIELHLRAEHPMSPEMLDHLESGLRSTRNVDHALFGFYVEWVRDSVGRLGASGRELVNRLDGIKLPL